MWRGGGRSVGRRCGADAGAASPPEPEEPPPPPEPVFKRPPLQAHEAAMPTASPTASGRRGAARLEEIWSALADQLFVQSAADIAACSAEGVIGSRRHRAQAAARLIAREPLAEIMLAPSLAELIDEPRMVIRVADDDLHDAAAKIDTIAAARGFEAAS